MKIIKRNQSVEDMDIMKIISVLHKANRDVEEKLTAEQIKEVAAEVASKISDDDTTEHVQHLVEKTLIAHNYTDVAKAYIIACYEKAFQRQMTDLDKSILSVIQNKNDEIGLENSNKDPALVTTQRDYIAGEVSKSISRRLLLDEDIVEAHDRGLLHVHDMDYYIQPITNCGLLNLKDMFENGTMVANAMIDPPKSLQTAATVATQIIASVASNQYGGITMSMAHLAPYVDTSRQKYIEEVKHENVIYDMQLSEENIKSLAERRLAKEIKDSIQTINYQLNSYNTTAGQTPFITIFLSLCEAKEGQERHDLSLLIEELLKQRIKGMKNKAGVYATQSFPKLIYVLEECNVTPESEYFYLTELSAKCTAKRMVPDYMSRKKLEEIKGAVIPVMGCRSSSNIDYSPQIYGKFNLGVVSINLPYIALSSGGDPEVFWKNLDDAMGLLYRAQMSRYKKLQGTKAGVAPILWSYGAYARLKEDEVIDELLKKEHSTISIGYIGLFEAVKYMSGKSHTDEVAHKFALDILNRMNSYAKKWTKETDLGWGIYGTPAESLTYKFAKACVRDFGTVDGEHNSMYLTNSYHVHVKEPIDAFNKLAIESEFQELSTGGAISYIETPNLQDNIPAVIAVLQYIYDNIMYAELNCKSDYCYKCGYSGEMNSFNNPDGSFGWECPECGNRDQKQLSVVRRTCGYLGENRGTAGWNKGRFDEITDRVLHL